MGVLLSTEPSGKLLKEVILKQDLNNMWDATTPGFEERTFQTAVTHGLNCRRHELHVLEAAIRGLGRVHRTEENRGV